MYAQLCSRSKYLGVFGINSNELSYIGLGVRKTYFVVSDDKGTDQHVHLHSLIRAMMSLAALTSTIFWLDPVQYYVIFRRNLASRLLNLSTVSDSK